jgi:hypothetical protein
MTPLPILFAGFVLTLFGGLMAAIGWSEDVPTLTLVGWGISGLAGVFLLVGLISWSVEIGVRSAGR